MNFWNQYILKSYKLEFEYIEKTFEFPGASLFQFLSFRAALAVLLSLGITLIYGKKIILFLKNFCLNIMNLRNVNMEQLI